MTTLTIREKLEQREFETLSEIATKSANSKGRKVEEEQSDLRTDFQRDRDRILHSKAFRRLKHKTQVFLSPFDDHFRTRLTHTLEVSQIARTIARALNLNEDLVEAISLGHDLGHTPFGHCGEGVLGELLPNGFSHNIQSVRVVEVLEDMNLCKETVDGILTHSWGYKPETPEAQASLPEGFCNNRFCSGQPLTCSPRSFRSFSQKPPQLLIAPFIGHALAQLRHLHAAR